MNRIRGEIDERIVAAQANDRLMELDIDVGILVEVRPHLAVVERREHAPQRRDLLVGGIFGNQTRRHAFERGPRGDEFDDLTFGLAHNVDAAARL